MGEREETEGKYIKQGGWTRWKWPFSLKEKLMRIIGKYLCTPKYQKYLIFNTLNAKKHHSSSVTFIWHYLNICQPFVEQY